MRVRDTDCVPSTLSRYWRLHSTSPPDADGDLPRRTLAQLLWSLHDAKVATALFFRDRKPLRNGSASRRFQKNITHDSKALTEKACRVTGDFSSPPCGGRIIRRMTRTTARTLEWQPLAQPSLDGGVAARICDACVHRRPVLRDAVQSSRP